MTGDQRLMKQTDEQQTIKDLCDILSINLYVREMKPSTSQKVVKRKHKSSQT